jgi:hypothetical protein
MALSVISIIDEAVLPIDFRRKADFIVLEGNACFLCCPHAVGGRT